MHQSPQIPGTVAAVFIRFMTSEDGVTRVVQQFGNTPQMAPSPHGNTLLKYHLIWNLIVVTIFTLCKKHF